MNVKQIAQSFASIIEPIKDACLAEHVGRWSRAQAGGLPTCPSSPPLVSTAYVERMGGGLFHNWEAGRRLLLVFGIG